MKQPAKYLGQRLFSWKVIVRTPTDIHRADQLLHQGLFKLTLKTSMKFQCSHVTPFNFWDKRNIFERTEIHPWQVCYVIQRGVAMSRDTFFISLRIGTIQTHRSLIKVTSSTKTKTGKWNIKQTSQNILSCPWERHVTHLIHSPGQTNGQSDWIDYYI